MIVTKLKNLLHRLMSILKPSTTEPEIEEESGVPFAELGLADKLVERLEENHFTIATLVQEKSIPAALNGDNIFCSSETGSGKTLSFLLPMIHKFYSKEIHQALIICPTREIAIQTHKRLEELISGEISSALVIGGTNMVMQKKALQQYPKILVATPGRLLDMLNTGLIWLEHTGYVVLDEADRMLDMGFEPDLLEIHSQLSGDHQTVLFSATLFPEIMKMAERYAPTYTEIKIGNPVSVAESVRHVVIEMRDDEKLNALKYIIARNPGKMIVFFNTIRETVSMTGKFSRHRTSEIDCIHSKIDQKSRERIIEDFREGEFDVLFASDIASRGIDIPNVDLVVNFNLPSYSEEYIHRVGRTGRAGQTGTAISFNSYRDKKKLAAIEELIKVDIEKVDCYRDVI